MAFNFINSFEEFKVNTDFFKSYESFRKKEINKISSNDNYIGIYHINKENNISLKNIKQDFTEYYKKPLDIHIFNNSKIEEIKKLCNLKINHIDIFYLRYLLELNRSFCLSEHKSLQTIFIQIYFMLKNINKNGIFILETKTISTKPFVQILYFLTFYFKSVEIFRPKIINPFNTNCFYIFKGFTEISKNMLDKLFDIIMIWYKKNKAFSKNLVIPKKQLEQWNFCNIQKQTAGKTKRKQRSKNHQKNLKKIKNF